MSYRGSHPQFDEITIDYNVTLQSDESSSTMEFPLDLSGLGLPVILKTASQTYSINSTEANVVLRSTLSAVRDIYLDPNPADGTVRTIVDEDSATTNIITLHVSNPDHLFGNNSDEIRLPISTGAMSFVFFNNKWYCFRTYKVKPILLAVPTIIAPNNAIGVTLQPTMQSSAYLVQGGTDVHLSSRWQVAKEQGFSSSSIVFDSGETTVNKTSITVTTVLTPNTTYYVRVRYKGQTPGWSAWSQPAVFKTAYIAKPTLLQASNVNIVLNPLLASSSFVVADGGSDTFINSQWQILSNNVVVYDSGSVLPLTQHQTPANTLQLNTQYQTRVRHRGNILGWSEWSSLSTAYTTGDKPSKPVANIPVGTGPGVSVALGAPLTAQPFVGNPSDSHQSSRWLVQQGGTIVYDSGETSDKLSHVVPDGKLATGTLYTVSVSFRGSAFGWSDVSDTQLFTTGVPAQAPTVLNPTGTQELLTPLCRITDFPATTIDQHDSTQWQVANGANFDAQQILEDVTSTTDKTTHTVAASLLNPSTTYYVRVRYKGTAFGWSAWSQPATQFMTGAKPNTPSIINPTVGATSVLLTPVLTSSAFASSAVDELVATRWWLRSASGGAIVTADEQTGLTYTITNPLLPGTVYLAKVQHKGKNFGWSNESPEVQFTTGSAGARPTVSVPLTTGANLSFLATASAFSPTSQGDAYAQTAWSVSQSQSFVGGQTTTVASLAVSGLQPNKTYYIAAQHKGTQFGWTQASDFLQFSTGYVRQPTAYMPTIPGQTAPNYGQPLQPTVLSSTFNVVGTDTCNTTVARIYNSSGTLLGSRSVSGAATSVAVPVNLSPATVYKASIEHIGAQFGSSGESPRLDFLTGYVIKPSRGPIVRDFGGSPALVGPRSNANGPGMSVDGQDTFAEYFVQISNSSNFAAVWNCISTTSQYDVEVPTAGLYFTPDTTYYARCAYKGASFGYSVWSDVKTFKTSYVYATLNGEPAPGGGNTGWRLDLPNGAAILDFIARYAGNVDNQNSNFYCSGYVYWRGAGNVILKVARTNGTGNGFDFFNDSALWTPCSAVNGKSFKWTAVAGTSYMQFELWFSFNSNGYWMSQKYTGSI